MKIKKLAGSLGSPTAALGTFETAISGDYMELKLAAAALATANNPIDTFHTFCDLL